MTSKNQNIFLQPLIYGLLIAIGIFIGIWLKPSDTIGIQKNASKIDEIIQIINQAYVDSVETNELQETAINEFLKTLDPHSAYIAAEDLALANEPLEGGFEGIGVEFNILDDTIYVVNVISGGPSEEAGLQSGDRIVKVEGEIVAGIKITNEKVLKLLKGPKGSKVSVHIVRHPIKEELPYTINRGKIPVYSIESSYLIEEQTGYVKIGRFAATTDDEFVTAVEALKKQGMEHLILDLRGNPGGYLSAAIQIADEFIDGKKLLVYTESRNQNQKVYKASKQGVFEKGNLIVLVDEGSASASEIVAGALQDWDRGLILGRRTFGKGLVQEPFALRDNSVLRLTVSRYYTPTGRCIQKPYEEGYENYQMELFDRWEHGEMETVDSIKKNDSLTYKTPGGRTVYGGGGIYPDIYAAIDTSYDRAYINKLYSNDLLRKWVYDYLEKNRSALKQYKTASKFLQHFSLNSKDWLSLESMAQANDLIMGDKRKAENTKRVLYNQIKALLARQLFDIGAFYQVLNATDHVIERANTEIRKKESFISIK